MKITSRYVFQQKQKETEVENGNIDIDKVD